MKSCNNCRYGPAHNCIRDLADGCWEPCNEVLQKALELACLEALGEPDHYIELATEEGRYK